jgi:hypothetical protein
MAEVEKVTDDFAYSNGDLATVSSGTFLDVRLTCDVSGGKVTTSFSGFAVVRHTGGSGWTDDQYAHIVVSATGASREGVGLRVNSDVSPNEDCYLIYYEPDATEVKILKIANSAQSFVGSAISTSFSNGDELKAYVTTDGADADFEVFKNGVSVGTRTDSSSPLTGGRPGLMVSSTGASIDTFRAGILTTPGTEDLNGSASTGGQTAPSVNFTVAL